MVTQTEIKGYQITVPTLRFPKEISTEGILSEYKNIAWEKTLQIEITRLFGRKIFVDNEKNSERLRKIIAKTIFGIIHPFKYDAQFLQESGSLNPAAIKMNKQLAEIFAKHLIQQMITESYKLRHPKESFLKWLEKCEEPRVECVGDTGEIYARINSSFSLDKEVEPIVDVIIFDPKNHMVKSFARINWAQATLIIEEFKNAKLPLGCEHFCSNGIPISGHPQEGLKQKPDKNISEKFRTLLQQASKIGLERIKLFKIQQEKLAPFEHKDNW